jgi:hypothetical protein
MAEIVFDPSFPVEVQKLISPYLDKWKFLIPGWVQTLFLMFEYESSDGTVIENISSYEYRRTTLIVYPYWLKHNFFEEQFLVHDLIHTFYSPVYYYAQSVIDSSVPDDNFAKSILKDTITQYNESATQDLTKVMMELMGKLNK